jgi:hypothetical protein
MATLVLSAAGSAIGGSIGGPLGATLGRAAGAIAGQAIDGLLFAQTTRREGPRLSDLDVQASAEGANIPRLYGRVRLAGQVIWATRYEEEATTTNQGGKGGPRVSSTTYSYYANFAVGLCEGPVTRIGRVWADGKVLDTEGLNIRFYKGDETQEPDPLIAARQGGIAPAYRGHAYVVFERLPLEQFGNRLPQLSFEVVRRLPGLEDDIRAITIIPGSTEFGYAPSRISRMPEEGVSESENRHATYAGSDWAASMDEVQALCPNLERVGLVVSWFGDDLRVGQCQIEPRVENVTKVTRGGEWLAAGRIRSTARVVSQSVDGPAFGGSPSDASVIAAIADLKARGLKVTLIPFIMMDIPAGNSLLDPYSGQAGQAVYPWRGRITCSPAPGLPGSPDKTSAINSQINALVGTAQASDFSYTSTAVSYSGPNEWSFRRFILHMAYLAKAAGGVDAFILGSELRGLTQLRSSSLNHPFVNALVTLASDVRGVLGAGTVLTYGADWSEYANYRPDDGSGDVSFHLDPLWASPDIDVIGIDNYLPLSDWREGRDHLDAQNGVQSVYDLDYLQGNIEGGEYADWFYASQTDREGQIRTPIADGAYGKSWVYQAKNLKEWWLNAHVNRVAGVETAATDWTAQSKPFWFIELGCPAVHLGSNQPNVFPDPKSSENALPYFSNGARDDGLQRRFCEAHLSYWADSANNPVSGVYGQPMVRLDAIHLWTWDARPYPWFPYSTNVWRDGPNWQTGHWLNGRLGAVPLGQLVETVCADYGFAQVSAEELSDVIEGTVIDRPMSARAVLEPLANVFGFHSVAQDDHILFKPRGKGDITALNTTALADNGADEALVRKVRAQETELPSQMAVGFVQGAVDFRKGLSLSRRLTGQTLREAAMDSAIVAHGEQMDRAAEIMLQDLWAGRESVTLALPHSQMALEPGDLIRIGAEATDPILEITRIEEGDTRRLEARRIEPSLFAKARMEARSVMLETPVDYGPPLVVPLDLPLFESDETSHGARLGVFAAPWPGTLAVYRSTGASGFERVQTLNGRATMGKLTQDLNAGPLGLWDQGNHLEVTLSAGVLSSAGDEAVLAGANLCAVQSDDGVWEVIQFAHAELIGPQQWRLSRLLRGQGGTEDAMAAGHSIGNRFILLNEATPLLNVARDSLSLSRTWRVGPAVKDYGDDAYQVLDFAPGIRGLQPLVPVHIKGMRDNVSGDIALIWIRRTRIGGDDWESESVPLGEESERYQLEIFDGATLVRSVDLSGPSYLYLAGDQLADFGSLPETMTLSLRQIGTGGRAGVAFEKTLVF